MRGLTFGVTHENEVRGSGGIVGSQRESERKRETKRGRLVGGWLDI